MTNTQKKEYQWYLNNPIISIWRKLDQNSVTDTVNYINTNWNVGDRPFEHSRVYPVLERYLELMNKFIKDRISSYRNRGGRYTRKELKSSFDLNETEANMVYRMLYPSTN